MILFFDEAGRSERVFRLLRGLGTSLVLALLVTIGTLSAAADNKSFQIRPGTAPEDAFPRIVRQADKSLGVSAGEVTIRVHYPEGQEELAARAAQIAAVPIEFLMEESGKALAGAVDFYIYPLEASAPAPAYVPHGKTLFTQVFLARKGVPLLEVPSNRQWYLEMYTHELAHALLHPYRIQDRWLDDGLAEYLKDLFRSRAIASDLVSSGTNENYELTLRDWNPPLVSLRRVEHAPWKLTDAKRLLRVRHKDPFYAVYLAQKEFWRYSAAAELLTRWMAAARAKGIEMPIRDLLQRIERRGGSIGWEQIGELIEEQTGTTLAALATPSATELDKARTMAWEERVSENLGQRIRALRVLSELGLPADAPSQELLGSFAMPPGVPDAESAAWNLHVATAAAVARAGVPDVCLEALAWLREAHGARAYFYGTPELWGCLAVTEPGTARELLLETMLDPKIGLAFQERAQSVLERLTGLEGGWSVTLGPEKRAAAAERWRQRLAALRASARPDS